MQKKFTNEIPLVSKKGFYALKWLHNKITQSVHALPLTQRLYPDCNCVMPLVFLRYTLTHTSSTSRQCVMLKNHLPTYKIKVTQFEAITVLRYTHSCPDCYIIML
jgi:hypothetical protein